MSVCTDEAEQAGDESLHVDDLIKLFNDWQCFLNIYEGTNNNRDLSAITVAQNNQSQVAQVAQIQNLISQTIFTKFSKKIRIID